MRLFKKKTKEQQMSFRASELMNKLFSETDYSFTDLERVQIANDFRRLFAEKLQSDRSNCMSKSVELQQKAVELKNILELLE